MAEPKTKPTKESVDNFVRKVTDAEKRADTQALIALMKDATKAEPVLWGSSIIGFGSYTYQYESGRTGDWPIIGLSPSLGAGGFGAGGASCGAGAAGGVPTVPERGRATPSLCVGRSLIPTFLH